MDCAFSFFQNYPCRLSYIELECELPCEESIFNSPHPFSEPHFRFSRDVIVREAFRDLFEENPSVGGSLKYPPSHAPSLTNPMQFTVLDMFIMIHRTCFPRSLGGHYHTHFAGMLLTPRSPLCVYQRPHLAASSQYARGAADSDGPTQSQNH